MNDILVSSRQQRSTNESNPDFLFLDTSRSDGVLNEELSPSFRFYEFLTAAQQARIDFLPITHQAALGSAGVGATSEIQQRFINPNYTMAFKRIRERVTLFNELLILSYGPVLRHPNIIGLEGISWEVDEEHGVLPILAFEKSPLGDLHKFMTIDVGKDLSLLERLFLCMQFGQAIHDLHKLSITHGDIKPSNILVFRNHSGNVVAKLTDFGFSHLVVTQVESVRISVPKSKPWNAPEHHHRGFTFEQAMKMDIFSFGVCCLWLLFYNNTLHSTEDFNTATATPEANCMLKLAKAQLNETAGINEELRETLDHALNICLAENPQERSPMSDVLKAFKSAQNRIGSDKIRTSEELKTMEVAIQPISSARFQIAEAMHQLFEVDFRVREQILQCFKKMAEESKDLDDQSMHQEVSLQLAFCYEIGFGVEKSDSEAKKWLNKSQMSDILRKQLLTLKTLVNPGYHLSTAYDFWKAKGHVPSVTDAQYYREQKQLSQIQDVHKREIQDWKVVLGPGHWIVISKIYQYSAVLLNLGYLEQAESLARESYSEVLQTRQHNQIAINTSKNTLARAVYQQGKLDEALMLVQQIIESQDNPSQDNNHFILMHKNFMACIYASQGKLDKALRIFREVLDGFTGALGNSHIFTVQLLWNLCETYRLQRRFKEAITLNEQLLEIIHENFGKDHEASALAELSLTRLRWKRRTWIGSYIGPRENGELREDCVQSFQRLLGNGHPITMEIMTSTVKNLVHKVRFEEAIALQEQILRMSEQRLGPEHSHTIAHREQLKFIKTMYKSYSFMAKIGSLRLGSYVLTPSFRVRPGLKRIFWPLYKTDSIRPTPISINTSSELD